MRKFFCRMKQVHDNSSIECFAADIISRRISPSSYMEIKNIGKCKTFKCTRNSEASITKELVPKKAIYNLNSLLDLNDKIESEDIFLAINCKRTPKIILLNHTGTHKAQAYSTTDYTFAKVSKQFPNIPQLEPPKLIKKVEELSE